MQYGLWFTEISYGNAQEKAQQLGREGISLSSNDISLSSNDISLSSNDISLSSNDI